MAALWQGDPVSGAGADVATLKTQDLVGFEENPGPVQDLIETALSLTRKKLGYRFGSNCPKKGGMDCSGAVQHVLMECGLDEVPRMSHHIFLWAKHTDRLRQMKNVFNVEHKAFAYLKPGDLLFWEGTHDTEDRNPPISHVMIYLGRSKKDGKHVAFGASNGRSFRGKVIHGVSVFDFRLPPEGSKSKFVAYGPVPGLGVSVNRETVSAE